MDKPSLAETHPDLAAQAHGWDPTTTTAGSGQKREWKCEHGHTWLAVVSSRSSAGNGCPVCSNQKVLAGYNDLATKNPALATQAHGWDPKTLAAISGKKVGWQCEHGHIWIDSVAHRSYGRNCPFCAGKRVLVGFNDFATTNPELATQAHGWDPTTTTAGSGQKREWKCEHNHVYVATIPNRQRGACPICSNQKVLAGYNDLATTNPELATQAHGWDPTTLTAGSNQKREWKCEHGHTWLAVVSSRSSAGNGCPVCSNNQVLAGYNDLATTNPELATQAHGWDPTTTTASSGKKVGWQCDLGHTWKTTVATRTSGTGCPVCAEYGFNPGKVGWLYLIDHDALDMFQIGISNVPENRLDRHARGGWEVIEVRGPMDGFLTQELERSSLMALKRRGATLGRKGSLEKFDGHTEAWTKESLQVTSIKQLLDWVYEDDHTL